MSKSSKADSKRNRRNIKKGRRKCAHIPTRPPLKVHQLRSGLSTLPQELYNMIFEAVFAVPSSCIRYVGKVSYKPPVQLQIDRQTRAMFSEKYYSAEVSWVFLCEWHKKAKPDTIGRWWASLDMTTKILLCRPRLEALGTTALADPKHPSERKLLRYPARAPVPRWFSFWYRWAVDGKKGVGCLFEVLQFLSPSDEYDGLSR